MSAAPRVDDTADAVGLMKQTRIQGVIPAVLTPWVEGSQGVVDTEALRRYVQFLKRAGVNGLFLAGTNGEGPMISAAERVRLFQAAVSAVRCDAEGEDVGHDRAGAYDLGAIETIGRSRRDALTVIAQVGAVSTAESVELASEAVAAGVDAVAVVSPYYYHYDEESLVLHFIHVAKAAQGKPVFVYNIPKYAGNDITPPVFSRLVAEVPNLAGIKDSSGSFARIREYLDSAPGKVVLVGTDEFFFPALACGAAGIVTAVGNVFPELLVSLYQAFQKGEWQAASHIQEKILRVRNLLKAGPGIAAYKHALSWRGLDFPEMVSPPLRQLTAEERLSLENGLGLEFPELQIA